MLEDFSSYIIPVNGETDVVKYLQSNKIIPTLHWLSKVIL